MFKNSIFKNTIIFFGLIFGLIYLVNYLNISPETKLEIKVISNEAAQKVR